MIQIDYRNRTPIYEQLIENVTNMVLSGMLKPDEQLPSIRQLSTELAINPNTVGKAFAELERRGIIYSLTGRGSFISGNTDTVFEKRRNELLEELNALILKIKKSGIPLERVILSVEKNYSEEIAE